VVGVAVLGQIVAGVCAASLPVQARRKISAAMALLMGVRYFALDVVTGWFVLRRQNCRRAGHKSKKNSVKVRTTTPLKVFVGLS